MRLIRKTALLAAIVAAFACDDAAAPLPIPRDFVLDNISGRPLPTYFSPTPESPTILSSTLHLDGSGHAVLTERRRQTVGGDVTFTTNYTYKITGDLIEFEISCPPAAICVVPPRGTITDTNLSLDMTGGAGAIVYNYRLPYALD